MTESERLRHEQYCRNVLSSDNSVYDIYEITGLKLWIMDLTGFNLFHAELRGHEESVRAFA